jgi:hypothetical protein
LQTIVLTKLLKKFTVLQRLSGFLQILQLEKTADGAKEQQESVSTNAWVNTLMPFHMVVQEQATWRVMQ